MCTAHIGIDRVPAYRQTGLGHDVLCFHLTNEDSVDYFCHDPVSYTHLDVYKRQVEDAGQRVAQHAAAGVAHVHGAGGVCGNIFHHHLLVLAVVAAAVAGALFQRLRRQRAEPRLLHVKIDDAGAGHLAALHRQLPEIKAFQQRSRYFLRGTAHGAGIRHGGKMCIRDSGSTVPVELD